MLISEELLRWTQKYGGVSASEASCTDGMAMKSMMHEYKKSILRNTASALIIAMFAMVGVGANIFKGETSTPLDLVASYGGWELGLPRDRVVNQERSDIIDARLPQWTFARNELREGRIPLWNPNVAGGEAAFLLPTGGFFTPQFALFAITERPANGFYLGVVLSLWLAGFGTYLLLHRWVGWGGALAGAIVFQFCGFNAAWLYWAQMHTLAWLPWLLFCVDGLLRNFSGRSGALWFAAVSIVSACVVLGGFPFVGQLVFGAALLYALTITPGAAWLSHISLGFRVKAIFLVAAALFMGIMVALIPTIAFVDWIGQYDMGYRRGGSGLRLADTWRNLVFPSAHEVSRVETSIYMGTIALFVAVIGVFFLVRRIFRDQGFLPFVLGLLAVGATLAFQLVPPGWVGWVPGLDINPWSRAISLVNFAVAMLAGVGFHALIQWGRKLNSRYSRAVALGLVGILAVLQIWDQIEYFRVFNGSTKPEYFYPETPAIAYLKQHAGPFDYVIADSNFVISGSLGGYGLREWYAHAFRSPSLRQELEDIVDSPFRSPTAASFSLAKVNVDASQFNLFNNRFLIGGDYYMAGTASLSSQAGMQPLPPLPGSSWVQPIIFKEERSPRELRIRFATYHATDVDGVVRLIMRHASDPSPVLDVEMPADGIEDNRYYEFPLPPDVLKAGVPYAFEVLYEPGPNGRPITAWAGAVGTSFPTMVDGTDTDRLIDYVVVYGAEGSGSDEPQQVAGGRGIKVWEVPAAPQGPYLVADMDDLRPDSEGVIVERYEPSRFAIRYTGSRAGYLVVPMRVESGWRATINGEHVDWELFRSAMPAFKVNGESVLEMVYAPEALRYFWWWLALMAAYASLIACWVIYSFRTPGAAR